mgnify:FL=1
MDNFKKEIWSVFIVTALLGVFFQINRMDALLYINPWQNNLEEGNFLQAVGSQQQNRENYLLIYDPADVQSVLTRHIVEKIIHEQKKSIQSVPFYQPVVIDSKCQGVVIATNKLKNLAAMTSIEQYVEQGGRAAILRNLQSELLPEEMVAQLGIASLGQEISVPGIRVTGDMFLGLQGFGFDSDIYTTSVTDVVLTSDAVPQVTSQEGHPIIWSHNSGQGKYIVCNSRERDDKNNYGIYTAILSQLKEDYIYPVMNMKLFFIDDFPSPVPEGKFERIYQETGLSTADFYRRLWWPEMLNNGEKYNVKYTGLIIENYGDQVKGPFVPLADVNARNSLIVYGRELLKAGGELGIHGYNHQSLAPAGYGQDSLGYATWESQADMEESLRELKRYIADAYPGYEIHAYVPPSNILSPEGKAAVKNVFTDIKVYSSLWNGLATAKQYFQNFQLNADGTCELPRVTSGHVSASEKMWENYIVVNYNGVFSHFVHPDEIFYEESENLTWTMMKQGLTDLLSELQNRFGWLEPVTATEGYEKMKDYFQMDYRVTRSEESIKINAWDFHQPLTFILRTDKKIGSVTGGSAQRVQANAYVLTVTDGDFEIKWAGE